MRDAIHRLTDHGFLAYVVGGSVRDYLLGADAVEAKDHDVATNANPDELCKLFPDAVTVGKAFGVIKVPTGVTAPQFVEIATFREDLGYGDHRHPRGVKFSGPEEDARRRDFTVNALFYDPKTSRMLDPTGGLDDLKRRVLRAIGDSSERFREDALRLLRAVRFTTRLGFALDPATADAVKARAKLIVHVSPERVRDELNLMWKGPRPRASLELLSKLGLLAHVLPEVEELKRAAGGEHWAHALKLVDALERQNPQRSALLVWAALLHESGAAPTKTAARVGARLHFSRAETERLVAIVEDHLKFRDVFQMREATLQRFVREPHFDELLAFHRADATCTDGNLAYYEFCASRLDQARARPLAETKLIDGEDLIQLGLSPGPRFTEILRTVEDLVMERKIHTKEEALEYVVGHFVR